MSDEYEDPLTVRRRNRSMAETLWYQHNHSGLKASDLAMAETLNADILLAVELLRTELESARKSAFDDRARLHKELTKLREEVKMMRHAANRVIDAMNKPGFVGP